MDHPNWIWLMVLRFALSVLVVQPEEVFNTTPVPLKSNFSCSSRPTGFYADVAANCKVYHTCDNYGNKFTYRCPEETAFRQDALICDHARLVDCQATTYSALKEENVDKRDSAGPSSQVKFESKDSINGGSFSRSFQVIQQPAKSTNKAQPGFVFSSSVFLRDLSETDTNQKSENLGNVQSTPTRATNRDRCEASGQRHPNIRKDVSSTTFRPPLNRFDLKTEAFERFRNPRVQQVASPSREDRGGSSRGDRTFVNPNHPNRAEFDRQLGVLRGNDRREDSSRSSVFPGNIQKARKESLNDRSTTKAPPSREFFRQSYANNRDYPYSETLRSIQANAKISSTLSGATAKSSPTTTEIPVHALTLSLKPLVPNELEYDPYYPRFPTSTEAYYTPSQVAKEKLQFRTSTRAPWPSIHFEIPAVLPDLNTLEDLVDRRKLFYIPRIKSH